MLRLLVFLLFVTGEFLKCYSQGSSLTANPQFMIMGRDFINHKNIYGGELSIKNKRIDQFVVDTTKNLIKLKLTGVTKKGEPSMWLARNLAVYDGANQKIKWSKAFTGLQSLLMTNKYTIYNLHNAHSLDVDTGNKLWGIDPVVWYINDAFNIGLSRDSEKRIQGINLLNGKVIWERKVKSNYGIGDITKLSDSVVMVTSNGLHTVNLFTGEGWDYGAKTVAKFINGADVAGFILDVVVGPPYGKNEHIVRKLYSNAIVEGDKIYFASYEKISCLTKGGQLFWEYPFSENIKKSISTSSIFIRGDLLYLVNKGTAEINFRPDKYGKPFLAAFKLANGAMQFYQPFLYEESIKDFKVSDSSLITVTKNSLTEYGLAKGNQRKIKVLPDDPTLGNLNAFANERIMRRTMDSSYVSLKPSDEGKHYILCDKKMLAVFDEDFKLIEKIPKSDLFIHWLTKSNYKFIGNEDETIIYDRESKKAGKTNVSFRARLIGDTLYDEQDGKLIMVNIRGLLN